LATESLDARVVALFQVLGDHRGVVGRDMAGIGSGPRGSRNGIDFICKHNKIDQRDKR